MYFCQHFIKEQSLRYFCLLWFPNLLKAFLEVALLHKVCKPFLFACDSCSLIRSFFDADFVTETSNKEECLFDLQVIQV